MKNAINDVEVYKAYLRAKNAKGFSVVKLCKKLRITRSVLYEIVNKVEKGDEIQLNRCLDKSKYDCLWKHRYFRRYSAIVDKSQLKALIKDMNKDGFGIREIARRVSKDPATVSYHLGLK